MTTHLRDDAARATWRCFLTQELPMNPLRRRMIDDMQIRNLTPNTQRVYLEQVSRFARHFGKSPERLGPTEIRMYLLHLVTKKRGRYEAKADAVRLQNEGVTLTGVNDGLYVISIQTAGLQLTDEQSHFLAEVRRTLTVIKVVFRERERPNSYRWFHRRSLVNSPSRGAEKQNYYVSKLARVARDGLKDSDNVKFEKSALEDLKNEFVAREADAAKNRYVRVLGVHAAAYGLAFFALYFAFRYSNQGYLGFEYLEGTKVDLRSGLLAILIGALCGISERALATVVSRRADEFTARAGGVQRPAMVQ